MKIYLTLLTAILFGISAYAETNVVSRENYPSGNIKSVTLRFSPTNSIEREYYESGQLRWEIPVGANGKKNGVATFYYPSGQIESVWQYTDNRTKPLKKFDSDGSKKHFVQTKWRLGKIMHKVSNLFVPASP